MPREIATDLTLVVRGPGIFAAQAADAGIAPVVLGIALLLALAWACRRWLDQANPTDGVPLHWLIISDRSGNEAIWEWDGERVAHDPFCPNDLLKMSPARLGVDRDMRLLGWQCARCAHSFRLRVAASESPSELIARKFDARLRRLGKPATVGAWRG